MGSIWLLPYPSRTSIAISGGRRPIFHRPMARCTMGGNTRLPVIITRSPRALSSSHAASSSGTVANSMGGGSGVAVALGVAVARGVGVGLSAVVQAAAPSARSRSPQHTMRRDRTMLRLRGLIRGSLLAQDRPEAVKLPIRYQKPVLALRLAVGQRTLDP